MEYLKEEFLKFKEETSKFKEEISGLKEKNLKLEEEINILRTKETVGLAAVYLL
jgi:hypothetical protein